ncbi:MAG: carbohydrate ABC transporter permease [Hungatella sp.]|nr:carbohydrate ABC transporter permease [Hungatella sp.]
MKKTQQLVAIIKTIVFTAIGLMFLAPLMWMISSSLKTAPEVFAMDFSWFPEKLQWKNYVKIWTSDEVSMVRAYLNTAWITGVSILVQLSFASMAAYGFAKINFRGKNVVFFLFLSTMMIPAEVTIIPRYMLFRTIGLYNNHWAIILPHWFSATAIFMLRQFYMGLPNDLMEAAKIDGASHPAIFVRILLPLTKSALVSLMVLTFISCWNEYLSPLIFLTKKNLYTISQVVRWYLQDEAVRYDLTMAAATSTVVPVIILTLCCQKYFVEGIATSGVKG